MNTDISPETRYDSLYLYLSRIQRGEWGLFGRTAKKIGLPDNTYGLAHHLFMLSYIDWDMYGGKSWNAAPPVWVQVADHCWCWLGFRSLSALESLTEQFSLTYQAQYKAPTSIFITSADSGRIERAAAKMGAKVIGRTACQRILSNLPPMRSFQPTLLTMLSPNGQIEMYEPEELKWRTVSADDLRTVPLGLIRYGHYFSKGFALLDAGKYYKIEGGIGQYHLFSRLRREVMHYDRTMRELGVPFTAELPFLYGRAILLESGCLPEKRGNWFVYQNVTAENAALAAQQLGQRLIKN
jgi:hypothetical protein